jgi:hypothetical protein
MFLCGVWATIVVGVDMVMHNKKIQKLKYSKIGSRFIEPNLFNLGLL